MIPRIPFALGCALILASALGANAHMIGDDAHDRGPAHYDWSVHPPSISATQIRILAMAGAVAVPSATDANRAQRPAQAKPFEMFAPKVKVHWDASYLFVEGNGLPAHNMMVGITAWQQQVPMPQAYFGENGWRIPLHPLPAAQPQTIKNHFLRGAIALAVNGIPIFNPQNNRGELSQEIGELDQWGGHCGRADDYHYHAAPLHLQSVLGNALPVAFALDGYPIYGLTETDGTPVGKLDEFNGHATASLGYHYHASTKYPYVNGGFHGEVVERGEQVDPQPRARPVREALPPLRGARITGFTSKEEKSYSLKYEVGGETRFVNYALNDNDTVKFDFVDGSGRVNSETYSPRSGGPGGEDHPPGEKGKGGPKRGPSKGGPGGPGPEADARDRRPGDRADARTGRKQGDPPAAPLILSPTRSGKFTLHSSVVADGGPLPAEFNGDGAGVSPPLDWQGAPAETKSFAVVMDHLAPGNEMKCYWTIWDIPATVTSLPKNAQGVGKLGPGFKGELGYEPPHSQGPGLKTYTIHVYALSAPPQLSRPTREVTREVLLAAIKGSILDSADLNVTYTRPGGSPGGPKKGEPKQ